MSGGNCTTSLRSGPITVVVSIVFIPAFYFLLTTADRHSLVPRSTIACGWVLLENLVLVVETMFVSATITPCAPQRTPESLDPVRCCSPLPPPRGSRDRGA